MRPIEFTYTLLAALPLAVNVGGLHIDMTRDGHVSIDSDFDELIQKSTHDGSSHGQPPMLEDRKIESHDDANKVHLGYETHQGFLTASGKHLNFSNIPYAAPPVDGLRWAPPQYPPYSDSVNKGDRRAVCPQYQVGWVPAAKEFVHDMLLQPVLPQKWKKPISQRDYEDFEGRPPLDPESSEDCLLLDVLVPEQVWQARHFNRQAPVLVWVHGGGFIYGSKHLFGSPEGLLAEGGKGGYDGIIHVSINYRLGAFGFMGGDKYLSDDGWGNLGLLDQKFAFEWVQQNIAYFGGDPSRITVMGESAGASSILHHLTSNPMTTPAFTGAIIQSPGFFPAPNTTQLDETYTEFLKMTGAKNLKDLGKADTDMLMQANADLTFNSDYGLFRFGPTVDNDYILDLPSKVLQRRDHHRGITIMIGHTKFEGLFFTPPWIRTSAQLREHVRTMYPGVGDDVLDKIDEKYPIGKFEFAKEKLLTVADFLDDVAIQCNTYYLTEAVVEDGVPTWRYMYNVVPAIHGADVPYTFYPSIKMKPALDKDLAKHWQSAIASFVISHMPNLYMNNDWPLYHKDDRSVLNFGSATQWLLPNHEVVPGKDKMDRERCDYWQDAPYYRPSKGKAGGDGGRLPAQERLEMV